MANIMNVDYEGIPSIAQQMRSKGEELNTELTTAYQSIADMHNAWYGKRYNELVKSFNNIVPQINEMLQLIVRDVPFALETVANNYSRADRGTNITSANYTAPQKISELTISNDVGMKFKTSAVASIQSKVTTNFKNAEEKMNTIESIYTKIQWQSEASEAFGSRFRELKTQILTAFNDIETQFTQLMNQAQEDIQSAENANTVQ